MQNAQHGNMFIPFNVLSYQVAFLTERYRVDFPVGLYCIVNMLGDVGELT